ncbi:MAG: hypothetical protein K8F25_06355 [Fimbriimonadaceae bacterium]|nr:hypothetical protein [Alphaproteobacteria bacterium]
MSHRSIAQILSVVCGCIGFSAGCIAYDAPEASANLLRNLEPNNSRALDENYRSEFTNCDGKGDLAKRDHFGGVSLRLANTPERKQYYLCSRDPSNVDALVKLKDGGILWESKMALDVDGSWVSWAGFPGATDQKETSYKWSDVPSKSSQAAQIDPDLYPFIVIPTAGLPKLTGDQSKSFGSKFSILTGLKLGDMGVVVYEDKWTPVFIADGGPFMRLGEGSVRVFETVGKTRCKKWNFTKTKCVGTGNNKYPYKNFGIAENVVFVVWPQSAKSDLNSTNAKKELCEFAESKLGLKNSAYCE